MDKGDLAKPGIVIKPTRELIGQLTNTYRTKEAGQIEETVGYHQERVLAKLQEMVTEDPEEYHYFLLSLRRQIKENNEEVRVEFETFFQDHPPLPESVERLFGLGTRVFEIEETPSPVKYPFF